MYADKKKYVNNEGRTRVDVIYFILLNVVALFIIKQKELQQLGSIWLKDWVMCG